MAYQQFHRSEGRRRTGEYVTIGKSGSITFSKDCMAKYFKGTSSVLFLYDPERSLAGIKPVKTKTVDSYDVSSSRGGSINKVTAIAFLKHFGINHEKTRRYIPNWNAKEGLLEIDLNSPL